MCLFLVLQLSVEAAIVGPNYNFSLEILAPFMPEQSLSSIPADYGQGIIVKKNGTQIWTLFHVKQLRFAFPILVQSESGKILDFHTRLPSFFLHDLFHQALINRYGAQSLYKKVEEEAYYQWKNDEREISYSASCTITCFPMYLAIKTPRSRAPANWKSIEESL